MFNLLNLFKLPTTPATADEMDSVAAKYRADRDHWRERAITAEAKVDRMTGGLRQNRSKAAAKGGV